jgi:hypothetical protein
MDMKIAIPSRGRAGNTQTIAGLPRVLRPNTLIVVPASQREDYIDALHQADGWSNSEARSAVYDIPDEDITIARKRHLMMQTMHMMGVEKVLMLDDDLFFYHRYWKQEAKGGNGDWRLLDSDQDTVLRWFGKLEERLSPDMPHGGFGPRQGNNNFPTGWVDRGSRMMLALGYHVPTALEKAEWGRIETREDMDVSLQLLRAGLPNTVTHDFCVGQKTYAAAGGCTGQRTQESSDADAHKLAEFHPGLVRVVKKDYKGHPRKEVVVQWKRALDQGRAGSQ